MFELSSFIVKNTVNGVKNGTFSKEYANIMAVNYMLKGVLAEEDVISINTQIEAWEAAQAPVLEEVDPSEEIPIEDLVEEETTEEPSEEVTGENTGDEVEEPTEEIAGEETAEDETETAVEESESAEEPEETTE